MNLVLPDHMTSVQNSVGCSFCQTIRRIFNLGKAQEGGEGAVVFKHLQPIS